MFKGLKITAITLCAVLLVCLFTVSFASTAEITASSIMVNGGSLEFTLLDDFSTAQSSLITTPYTSGTVEFEVNAAGGKSLKINIDQNENVSVPSYIAWDGTTSSGFVHKTDASTKYIAINLTVTGTVKFSVEPLLTGYGEQYSGRTVQSYICSSGDDIYLVDNNGATTVAQVEYMDGLNRYAISNIPQNFNGYVVIPTSRFTDSIAQDNQGSWNKGNMEGFVNIWTLQFLVSGTSQDFVTMHDCYYSSSAINYNAASWIKSMEKTQDGVASITYIDNFPADTFWSEIAIFTSPQNIQSVYDIYDNRCDRGERNATVGYVNEGTLSGTVGPNNTAYDFPYQFMPGTTYYVYVARCNMLGQWSYQAEPYVFTYPQSEQAMPTLTATPQNTLAPETTPPVEVTTTEPPESEVVQTPTIPTVEKETIAPEQPTQSLTQQPTTAPEQPTAAATKAPTKAPTAAVTKAPTKAPSTAPAPQNTPEQQPQESLEPTAPQETESIQTQQPQTQQPTEQATTISTQSPVQTDEPLPQPTEPQNNNGGSTVIIIIAIIAVAGAAIGGFLLGRKKKLN